MVRVTGSTYHQQKRYCQKRTRYRYQIYSNCDHIHLKVNGQDCGHPDREDGYPYLENVSLKRRKRIEAS